jgi:hypothetical protein
MIRHALPAPTLSELPLTVAVVESSFRALLMPAVGGASLSQARLLPAHGAAISLAPVTVGTEKEKRATFGEKAKPLPQNHFATRRHADLQAALDNGRGFVAG